MQDYGAALGVRCVSTNAEPWVGRFATRNVPLNKMIWRDDRPSSAVYTKDRYLAYIYNVD